MSFGLDFSLRLCLGPGFSLSFGLSLGFCLRLGLELSLLLSHRCIYFIQIFYLDTNISVRYFPQVQIFRQGMGGCW